MSEMTFDDYKQNLRDHPDAGVRANAAWRMGHLRDYRCLEPLLAAIHDDSAAVRARVMEALGSRREPEVTVAIRHGLSDPDEDVRAMAARAAALVAATELTPVLYELLHDPSPRVVGEAIQALAYSDDDDVGVRLVAVLLANAEEVTVRYFVRQALSHRGGGETVTALVAVLAQSDAPVGVVIDALEILAQMHVKAARAAVEPLLHHPDEDVQTTAHWALGQL